MPARAECRESWIVQPPLYHGISPPAGPGVWWRGAQTGRTAPLTRRRVLVSLLA
jgi:hypothetical protein